MPIGMDTGDPDLPISIEFSQIGDDHFGGRRYRRGFDPGSIPDRVAEGLERSSVEGCF